MTRFLKFNLFGSVEIKKTEHGICSIVVTLRLPTKLENKLSELFNSESLEKKGGDIIETKKGV